MPRNRWELSPRVLRLGMTLACLVLVGSPTAIAQSGGNNQRAAANSQEVGGIVDKVMARLEIAMDRHWHKGEYNHIVNLSRVVIAAHPDDLETIANAGYLLWSMDRDADAIALYEQGLKDNPKSSYMYDELGQ